RELNEPSEVQPTAKHVSVTDMSPRLSRALARSILRVMRWLYGLSPNAALKLREKWPVDIAADRAMAGTSSGRSNSRSIRSFALRSLTTSRMSIETASMVRRRSRQAVRAESQPHAHRLGLFA